MHISRFELEKITKFVRVLPFVALGIVPLCLNWITDTYYKIL